MIHAPDAAKEERERERERERGHSSCKDPSISPFTVCPGAVLQKIYGRNLIRK
jgi:hypothetical protein